MAEAKLLKRPLFFATARTALKAGLLLAGLKDGGRVLVPDFICDAALQPIRQRGLIPHAYPVDDDLNPCWTSLETTAVQSKCRALVMVHYFGQPQDVMRFRAFCDRHSLLLIEDNAHGYGGRLAGRPLGSFGDVGVSSPRKLLNIPSGGVLHDVDVAVSDPLSAPVFPVLHPLSLAKIALFGLPAAMRLARKATHKDRDWTDPRLYREPARQDHAIDGFSRRRILSADWAAIAERRRAVWSAWSRFALAAGLRTVFPEVHAESCPWAMPAYASDMTQRNAWLKWGVRHGLPLFPWPALPEDAILARGRALARWERMICFPVDAIPDLGRLADMPP